VQIFNTGIKLNGINVTQISASPADAEMLRLNTAFGQPAAAAQNSALGALGCFDNPTSTAGSIATLNPSKTTPPDCDTAGFPERPSPRRRRRRHRAARRAGRAAEHDRFAIRRVPASRR
jgi:hypothetical protein